MKTLLLFCFFVVMVAGLGCNRHMNHVRIVLLPDTQTYAEKYPEILDSQVNWILRESDKIDFVLQQGDLTQNNNSIEWERVKSAFSRLDNEVKYSIAAGNHDMGSTPGKFADVRNTDLFNQYFPQKHMSGLPAYGGTYETGKMENVFYLFQSGRIKWLVITLEFGPRNEVLDWANKIVDQYPNHAVIVNTHSYLYSDSTRQSTNDSWPPQNYGVGKDTGVKAVNNGEQIWEKLVKKHANIRWVFSGHILNGGVGTLISINETGLPVYQMLANYQEGVRGSVKGGNGWLRIIDMDFKKKTTQVTTYSPYLNEFMNNPAHRFLIKHVYFAPN